MGMFDIVNFICPGCEDVLEIQSKAGECMLDRFYEDRVPPAIAEDIEGEKIYCEKCDAEYKVQANTPIANIKMELV